MTTCITHEPNHEITGYRTPITGTFVCDVCGAGWCSCNEDTATCEKCGTFEHYESENMVLGANMLPELLETLAVGNWDYFCMDCYLTELTEYNKKEEEK